MLLFACQRSSRSASACAFAILLFFNGGADAKPSHQDTETPRSAKTLVMIFGAPRTIVQTHMSIVRNLILPNEPCDVVVGLDDASLPPAVSAALAPWLVASSSSPPPRCPPPRFALRALQRCNCAQKEATLRWVAAAHLRESLASYAYAISVRTDAYVSFPFSVRAAHEPQPAGLPAFAAALRLALGRDAISRQELMHWWIVCAGSHLMIPLRMSQPEQSIMCPICVASCNTTSATAAVGRAPLSELQPLHVFGSSWLVMGTAAAMHAFINEHYFAWGKTFRTVFGITSFDQMKDVCAITEVQLRLSIFRLRYTLVDYMGRNDWDINDSIAHIVASRHTPVFIVRPMLHLKASTVLPILPPAPPPSPVRALLRPADHHNGCRAEHYRKNGRRSAFCLTTCPSSPVPSSAVASGWFGLGRGGWGWGWG